MRRRPSSTLLAQALNSAAGNGDNMAKRTEGTKKLLNQVFLCVFLAAVYVLPTPSADGMEFDNRTITCRAFLASGQNNMAALIMWLFGYHAGKTGIIPYQDHGPYAGRLGTFCKQHPDANLIEASETILTELDHGT
jgi:acid stress chaperone HdeB